MRTGHGTRPLRRTGSLARARNFGAVRQPVPEAHLAGQGVSQDSAARAVFDLADGLALLPIAAIRASSST